MDCPLNKALTNTVPCPCHLLSPSQRTQVGDEGKLIPVLQMLIQSSSSETAMEAALCLGFLRPCSNTAREFLLQRLYQGPMTQRIKV